MPHRSRSPRYASPAGMIRCGGCVRGVQRNESFPPPASAPCLIPSDSKGRVSGYRACTADHVYPVFDPRSPPVSPPLQSETVSANGDVTEGSGRGCGERDRRPTRTIAERPTSPNPVKLGGKGVAITIIPL